jgi:hypothetical protein
MIGPVGYNRLTDFAGSNRSAQVVRWRHLNDAVVGDDHLDAVDGQRAARNRGAADAPALKWLAVKP